MKKQDKKQDIIDILIEQNNPKTCMDISNMFSNMYGAVVQRLLDAEMDDFLGYDKSSHDTKTDENRRNGVTSKSKQIKTDNGQIFVTPPRDRNGKFEPIIIKKRQRVLEGLDDIVISMYAKGLSLNDIKDMIKKIYSIELSHEKISNLTNAVSEEVTKWQNRPLKDCYIVVYVDCLYCHLKQDLVSKKTAIYVALGINTQGQKEVLGIWINETESASFWYNIFLDIKERGVDEIFFVCMDGLSGLPEAIEKVYPKTITQRCIVHLVRNLYSMIPRKDVKQVIADFKKIYTSSSKTMAKLAFEDFIEKYKDTEKIVKKVTEYMDHIYGLFEYPESIRKLIYTTNAIESVNSALRKVTRGKGSFISKEALTKILFLRVKDLEKKWSGGIANWKDIRNSLTLIFEDRFIQYIKD